MITKEDKILIKNLRESNSYGAWQLNQKLPDKKRNKKIVKKVASKWFA